MNVKKIAAIAMIVIGILGLVYGAFSHIGETRFFVKSSGW